MGEQLGLFGDAVTGCPRWPGEPLCGDVRLGGVKCPGQVECERLGASAAAALSSGRPASPQFAACLVCGSKATVVVYAPDHWPQLLAGPHCNACADDVIRAALRGVT